MVRIEEEVLHPGSGNVQHGGIPSVHHVHQSALSRLLLKSRNIQSIALISELSFLSGSGSFLL